MSCFYYFQQCIAKEEKLGYSVIIKAELYAGLRNSEEDAVISLLNSMNEFPVDGKTAKQAGEYSCKLWMVDFR